jgi:hypothetical protein
MRRVKPVMIGRHILAWLWLLLWLTASPGAHARLVASGAAAPAFASTDGQGNPQSHDLEGLHFRALRASRRADFQSIPTDPPVGIWFFAAGIARQHDACGLRPGSEVSLRLASGWQFLLRTALSPRAPSFVS